MGLVRTITHFIFRARSFSNKSVKNFAKGITEKKILELGSGKKHNGWDYYSAKQFFDSSNDFIQSDISRDFGHKIIDVTNMKFNKKFDVILCLSVLEHVFDFQKAIDNIHKALKNNGVAVIFVPAFYPLHDEPSDYWRFTEHSLKKLLSKFQDVKIKNSGLRKFPSAYYIEAYKSKTI